MRTLNSLALWVCNTFGPAGPIRVVDEMGVRDLVGELFEVKRQANTDTTAPYLAALSLVRLGLVSPEAAEEAYPDASGIAEGFDRYRAALAERGAWSTSTSRSTGPSRSWPPTRRPGRPPRPAAGGCWSTSSRT